MESDEDSESVMSSNISDLGSPAPSTPRTPRTPCVTPSMSHRFTDNEDSQVIALFVTQICYSVTFVTHPLKCCVMSKRRRCYFGTNEQPGQISAVSCLDRKI